jgi:peptidoglycan/LPS O-acetylase OafA/YrhL
MSSANLQYRADIDGLRAIAVGAVVLFHALPTWLAGGYVGVDIFFVISGFLITGILVQEVEQQRFSVLRFYIRRARRLFPALALVLLAVLAAGWWLLLPGEFSSLGQHVAAGAFFISNLALWHELGYFDVSAELKPLLHLWSLGVEEQYYLVWPLIVLACARRRRLFWGAVAALLLLSFGLNAYYIKQAPSSVFYLPLTRFWELLVGSALAMAGPGLARWRQRPGAARATDLLSLAGLALLLVAVLTFDRSTFFPGWAALLPVAGAAGLIAAGPQAAPNRLLLAHPAMVALGLISYPLYLWHWPLLAYAHITGGPALAPAAALALMALAVLLAWLTTHLVEARIRAPARNALAARDAARLWLLISALGLAGGVLWLGKLAPWSARLPQVQQYTEAARDWVTPKDRGIAGDSPEQVLFMGDSHMQQYLPRIVALMQAHPGPLRSVRFATRGGCAPLRGLDRRSEPCDQFTAAAYRQAWEPATRTVVMAASWAGFAERDDYFRSGDPARRPLAPYAPENGWVFERWADDIRALRQAGKRVVLVTSSPRGALVDPRRRFDRSELVWHVTPPAAVPRAALAGAVARYDARVRAVAAATGAELIDPFALLCDQRACAVAGADGRPLYLDDSHLRASFVQARVPLFDALVTLGPPAGQARAGAP